MDTAVSEPRVEYGMPAHEYHAVRAMSKSSAAALLRSPAHWFCDGDAVDDEIAADVASTTPAQAFGKLVHAMVLEPHTVGKVGIVRPDWNLKTKAGREERDSWRAKNPHSLLFSADDWQRAKDCASAIQAHPAARLLLDGGRPEVSIFWNDERTGVPCKCRPDYLRDDLVIVDLKTTEDASPEAFARTCARFNYHAGHAHYSAGVQVMYGETPRSFILIAAEPHPPFGVAVYELDAEAVEAGARVMAKAADAWKEAAQRGWNTCYPPTIQPLTLPRWATYQPAEETV